jgi:hypothetical protein
VIKNLKRLFRSLRGTGGLVDDLPSTEAVQLRLVPVGGGKGPALYASRRGEVRSPGEKEPKP